MPTLDARISALESKAQTRPDPGGAMRIYEYCAAHGIDPGPKPAADQSAPEWLRGVPSAVRRALLDIRDKEKDSHAKP